MNKIQVLNYRVDLLLTFIKKKNKHLHSAVIVILLNAKECQFLEKVYKERRSQKQAVTFSNCSGHDIQRHWNKCASYDTQYYKAWQFNIVLQTGHHNSSAMA